MRRPGSATAAVAAASARRHVPGGTGATAGSRLLGETDLQGEYISNLQQQVYFLELELKLIRDKTTMPPPPAKTRGTETNDEVELAQAHLLEDPIRQLKVKYVEREQMHKRETEQMRRERDDIEAKYVVEAESRRRAETSVRDIEARMAEQERRLAEDKQKIATELAATQRDKELLEKDILRMKAELERADADRSTREERFSVVSNQLAELRIAHDALVKSDADQTKKVGRLEDEMRQMTEQLNGFTAGERKVKAVEESLVQENKDLRSENRKLLLDKKTAEVEIERLKGMHSQVTEDYAALLERNTDMQTRLRDSDSSIARLTAEVTKYTQEAESARSAGREAVEKRAELEGRIAELESKLAEMQQMIGRSEQAAAKAAAASLAATEAMARMEREAATRQEHYASLDASNAEFRAAVRIGADERAELSMRLRAREDRCIELEREVAAVRTRCEQMEHRLGTSKQLDKVQMKEFASLMSTNLQVAESIRGLMEQMGQVPGTGPAADPAAAAPQAQ